MMIKSKLYFTIVFYLSGYLFCGDCLADKLQFSIMMKPIVDKAVRLVEFYRSNMNNQIPIIAIAGAPAVGKTYFANQLAELLINKNIKVVILNQDEFLERNKIPGYLIHPYLNYQRIHRVLQSILEGQRIIMQPVERVTKPIDYTDADIVIFEGVYSLCGPESFDFFKYCSFGIFMEGNEKNVALWHWQREQNKPKDSRRSKSKFKSELKLNMIDYHSHILPCRHNGEFIVYKKEKNKYCLRNY